jgi:hypothetical protein
VSLVSFSKELKGKRFKELRAKIIHTVAKISTAARGFVIILSNFMHHKLDSYNKCKCKLQITT